MSEYSDDPFFKVDMTQKETSEGMVDLPIRYYDVYNVIAFFLGDKKGAEEVIKDTPYKLGLKLFGRPLIGLSFYQYNHTDIGSYNEAGIAIPVLRKDMRKPFSNLLNVYSSMKRRKLGYYVLDLPVSTAVANAAGREIWGYPKFVTDIPFNLEGRQFSSSVMDPETNQPIVTLEGKIGWGFKVPPLSLLLYSTVNGQDIKTDVNVRTWPRFGGGRRVKLSVGDSDHHMAQHLRTLGLDGKKPLLMMHTKGFQSLLNDGRPV